MAAPLLTPSPPFKDYIEQNFWQFHLANPEVYNELRDLALRLRNKGRKHYGIKALYEIVRFNRALHLTTTTDFYLNNNYTSLYARLLMQEEPALRDFFKTRLRRTPCSRPRHHTPQTV